MRLILVALLFAPSALAQQAIQGTVRDQTGTAAADANVKLISNDQLIAEGSTDSNGAFQFSSLHPGEYRLAVVKTGLCISHNLKATLLPDTGDAKLNVYLEIPNNTSVPRRIQLNGLISRPRVLRSPMPEYPPSAKAQALGGTVSLSVLIDEYGDPIDIQQSLDSSPLFIRSSLATVQQWRFHATALNCLPVQVETDVRFEFVGETGTVR